MDCEICEEMGIEITATMKCTECRICLCELDQGELEQPLRSTDEQLEHFSVHNASHEMLGYDLLTLEMLVQL